MTEIRSVVYTRFMRARLALMATVLLIGWLLYGLAVSAPIAEPGSVDSLAAADSLPAATATAASALIAEPGTLDSVEADSLPAATAAAASTPTEERVTVDSLGTQSVPAATGTAVLAPTQQLGSMDSLAGGLPAAPGASPDSTRLVVDPAITGGDRLGMCLATLPDQNSDGLSDVAVAAPGSDRKAPNAGAVLILTGHSGDTIRILEGERAGDAFGASLAAVADLDRDGVADLAVAATQWDRDSTSGVDVGKVYVFSGTTGGLIFSVSGEVRGARLGLCLTGLGDTNGDGVADLATAQSQSPADSVSRAGPACVLILSGVDGSLLRRMISPQINDRFGSALCSAGDLNSDGSCDLLVGAYRHSEGTRLSTGAVYAISGSTGEILLTIVGGEMFEQFGYALAGGADLDGDRIPDFAVGARFQDQDGGRRGRVFAFSGKDGSALATLSGFKAGQQFGSALRFVTDQDGDEHPDLLVGAAGSSWSAEVSEAVYQLSSHSGTQLLAIPGEAAGNGFGGALDWAPDLDGDGKADLFVGAPHSADGGQYSGKCYAVSGRAGSVLWSCTGRSSLKRVEAAQPNLPLMNLEQLHEEVGGYDFPTYDSSEVDAAPTIRRSMEAIYPASALSSGLSGWVKVKILVLPDGSATALEVEDDAGLGPEFRDAALAAAREWSFLPASRAGEEVACWAIFPIGFAPPLSPEDQRRMDSLATQSGSPRLSVDSLPANVGAMAADSGAAGQSLYELDQVDVKPVLTARVDPEYPSPALISRENCTVTLRVLVNREGAVADVQMGAVTVHGKGFEGAAVAAVGKWRYEPALKGGARVAVWVSEDISFTPPGSGQ